MSFVHKIYFFVKARILNKLTKGLTTIVSLLLCFFFLVQIGNKVYYSHSHVLENGRVITHAHPYNKTSDATPYKSHHHSSEQFFFLDQPEILFLFIAVGLFSIIAAAFYLYFKRDIHYSSQVKIHLPGRSPPHF